MFYFIYLGTILILTPMAMFLIFNFLKQYGQQKLKGKMYTVKNMMLSIILTFTTIYIVIIAFPYWMDFPRFITHNYTIIEGKINNVEYWDGKEKYTNITIDNNTYKFYGDKYPPIGSSVIAKYLPNTKLIYNIESK